MATFTYTALRSVVAGRTVGASYSVTPRVRQQSPRNDTKKVTSIALSGATQTVVSRRDKFISFSTVIYDGSTPEYLEVVEFLESVDESETFIVNAGQGPQLALLTGNYTQKRNGQTNEWSFLFEIRILP